MFLEFCSNWLRLITLCENVTLFWSCGTDCLQALSLMRVDACQYLYDVMDLSLLTLSSCLHICPLSNVIRLKNCQSHIFILNQKKKEKKKKKKEKRKKKEKEKSAIPAIPVRLFSKTKDLCRVGTNQKYRRLVLLTIRCTIDRDVSCWPEHLVAITTLY